MTQDPDIRPERSDDLPGIHDTVTLAFGRDTEAAMVDGLRQAGALAESLVADVAGDVVGHAALSEVTVAGISSLVVGLAPLAVRPDYQRRGIGTALVAALIARCTDRGDPLLVVLGDPGFYGRFGFRAAADLGLVYRDTGPALQVLPLIPEIRPPAGEVRFHDAIEAV